MGTHRAITLAALLEQSKETDVPDAFVLQNGKLLKVNMAASGGQVLTKAGAMIAYQGQMTFSKKGGGAAKWLKKAVSGESFTLMEVTGQGDLFLADGANDIVLLYLNNESIGVESLNLLAFTPSINWDITMIKGAGGMMAGGLFCVQLSGTGYLALISKGEPMALAVTPDSPTYTDPNATIAWSSNLEPSAYVDANLKGLKGIYGSMTSGETFQLAFQGQGYVIVQPSEVAPTTTMAGPGQTGGGPAGGLLGGILGGA
ncbi:MAG: AIM24 family protein [Actinomycetota bacterium]